MGNVIKEIRFIQKEMPWVKEIFIQDDTLPAWRARELSQAILDAGLKVTWSCYARADATMDYETLSLMKRSGCRIMHVGYETSDPEILRSIVKGTKRAIRSPTNRIMAASRSQTRSRSASAGARRPGDVSRSSIRPGTVAPPAVLSRRHTKDSVR